MQLHTSKICVQLFVYEYFINIKCCRAAGKTNHPKQKYIETPACNRIYETFHVPHKMISAITYDKMIKFIFQLI